MANAGDGALWITIQTHTNIVAVSSLNNLAGVLIARGKRPSDETIAEAQKQGVAILVSQESTFDVAGRLYEMGVRGTER
jgi:predicted transcriptional regulator